VSVVIGKGGRGSNPVPNAPPNAKPQTLAAPPTIL
jgi:hypothetical protein